MRQSELQKNKSNYRIDFTNIRVFGIWLQLVLLMWQLSWDSLMFRHTLWSMWLRAAGRLHQNRLSAAFEMLEWSGEKNTNDLMEQEVKVLASC